MMLPAPKDALHKAMLYRTLTAVLDEPGLGQNLHFIGGTAGAMLGYLDRFSIDLDFDLKTGADKEKTAKAIGKILPKAGFRVSRESREALLFSLKYPSRPGERNTVKLGILDTELKTNVYQPQFLPEISRYASCQTIETMFSYKLVAVTDRYDKHKTIAGRDIYDIYHFFLQGYCYLPEIIRERTGKTAKEYLGELACFIDQKVSQKVIEQDLNTLLPREKFLQIRKTLKQEVLVMVRDDIERLG